MSKLNLERVKRRIDRVLAGRDFLRNIEDFRIPRPWASIEIPHSVDGEEMALEKPSKIKSLGVQFLNKAADFIDYGLALDHLETCLQELSFGLLKRVLKRLIAWH